MNRAKILLFRGQDTSAEGKRMPMEMIVLDLRQGWARNRSIRLGKEKPTSKGSLKTQWWQKQLEL